MYLVSKESIGNCRNSSDFNGNLMKIRKKIKRNPLEIVGAVAISMQIS